MNKKLYLSILLLFIFTLIAYGQITFQENINPKANDLVQRLSQEGDSLLLTSLGSDIERVDILGDYFSDHIIVNDLNTEIDLKKLPLGDYIIQAKVDQRWIVMYLKKNENIEITSTQPKTALSHANSTVGSIDVKNQKIDNPKYYWVVSESNSSFGSYKSMTLESKADIERLISKNKLELKSNIGKDNKLSVYVIYNKSKFMSKQLRNPDYYKSTERSNVFNTEPYYISEHVIVNDSRP